MNDCPLPHEVVKLLVRDGDTPVGAIGIVTIGTRRNDVLASVFVFRPWRGARWIRITELDYATDTLIERTEYGILKSWSRGAGFDMKKVMKGLRR